jgi:hypothetical protein
MAVLPLALLVTIRLYDTSGMPDADLHSAMLTADAALRSGAVAAAWVVCPSPGSAPAPNSSGCTGLPHEADLLLRIVRAPETVLSADTLGFAAVDTTAGRGTLATVFADRIVRLAARSGMDGATLVGYAMAHEIGHLLLGTDAHAPRGLMRAGWTVPEISRHLPRDWRFSREDAARMLSATARTAAAALASRQAARADRSTPPDATEAGLDAPRSDLLNVGTSSTLLAALPTPTAATLCAR